MTLKAILCFFLSTKECCELGIVTEKAAKWIEKMQVAITETANTELAAGDMIKLRDKDRTDRINMNLKSIENRLSNDDLILSEKRKLELLAEKDALEKRKQSIKEMWQNPDEKVNRRRIQQRKKKISFEINRRQQNKK